MTSPSAKILSLVTSAIKNLQEMKGSTSKEILSYITHLTNLSSDTARRQLKTALKRGVAYGIIRKKGCHYTLPTDTECECQEVAAQELGLLDLRCRRRRSEKRRRRRGCKPRRRRRRGICKCKKKATRRRSRKRSCRRRARRKRKNQTGGHTREGTEKKAKETPDSVDNNETEYDFRIESDPTIARERRSRQRGSVERNSRSRSSSKESDNPFLN